MGLSWERTGSSSACQSMVGRFARVSRSSPGILTVGARATGRLFLTSARSLSAGAVHELVSCSIDVLWLLRGIDDANRLLKRVGDWFAGIRTRGHVFDTCQGLAHQGAVTVRANHGLPFAPSILVQPGRLV